ncbi:unnamed protein product, partial [Protopolystoma xenopodis]
MGLANASTRHSITSSDMPIIRKTQPKRLYESFNGHRRPKIAEVTKLGELRSNKTPDRCSFDQKSWSIPDTGPNTSLARDEKGVYVNRPLRQLSEFIQTTSDFIASTNARIDNSRSEMQAIGRHHGLTSWSTPQASRTHKDGSGDKWVTFGQNSAHSQESRPKFDILRTQHTHRKESPRVFPEPGESPAKLSSINPDGHDLPKYSRPPPCRLKSGSKEHTKPIKSRLETDYSILKGGSSDKEPSLRTKVNPIKALKLANSRGPDGARVHQLRHILLKHHLKLLRVKGAYEMRRRLIQHLTELLKTIEADSHKAIPISPEDWDTDSTSLLADLLNEVALDSGGELSDILASNCPSQPVPLNPGPETHRSASSTRHSRSSDRCPTLLKQQTHLSHSNPVSLGRMGSPLFIDSPAVQDLTGSLDVPHHALYKSSSPRSKQRSCTRKFEIKGGPKPPRDLKKEASRSSLCPGHCQERPAHSSCSLGIFVQPPPPHEMPSTLPYDEG